MRYWEAVVVMLLALCVFGFFSLVVKWLYVMGHLTAIITILTSVLLGAKLIQLVTTRKG